VTDTKAKRLSGQALKDVNHGLAKLRKLGLYNGKAARGQPTAYGKSLLKRFADVISGTAAVVKVPKASRATVKTEYAGQLDFARGKLIVPKNPLNAERVRFSRTTEQVTVTGTGPTGRTYHKTIAPSAEKLKAAGKPTSARYYQIIIPGHYESLLFDRKKDLLEFIERYESESAAKGHKFKPGARKRSWRPYIERVTIDY
jgi:hypothetical protein